MTMGKAAASFCLADLAGHLTFVEQIEEDMARFKIRLEHIDGCAVSSPPTLPA